MRPAPGRSVDPQSTRRKRRGTAPTRNDLSRAGRPQPDLLAQVRLSVCLRRDQLVGLTGFEPAASSSRTRRATKLRHSPMRTSWPRPVGPQPAQPYRSSRGVSNRRSGGPGGQGQEGCLGPAGDADAGVRAGADTRRDVQPRARGVAVAGVGRVPVEALGPGVVEVAVGGEGADEREADLPAVGVTARSPRRSRRRRTGRGPAGTARGSPRAGRRRRPPQARRPGRAGRSGGAGRRRRRTRTTSRPPRARRAGW